MSTVIVVSQKLNKASRVLNFSGNTFGDLLALTTQDGINVGELYDSNEVEVIVNPGNLILRGIDSALPSGDLKVFFTVKKNKAGMLQEDLNSLSFEIKNAIYEKQKIASAEEKQQLKQLLIETVNSFYNVQEDTELKKALEELNKL